MTGEPISYDAEQAARIVHKTAYWMKKKARLGLIPHSRVGRDYLWTPAHLDEILRAGEKRPRAALVPRSRPVPVSAASDDAPVLQARQPRRRRKAA